MPQNPFLGLLLLCSLTCAAIANAQQPGLLGHWKFDEGQGDVAIDSSTHA